ncbi:hypothetical protein niasHT_015809 [Heterodera trifolii]|uniref:SAP domain-containing protein n=1 Tax=Heterodera trifolii TaxID=157864 RepID=A0ABD2L4V9_9BILA
MSFGKQNAWARPQGSSQPQQINPNLFMATAGQAFSTLPGMPINSSLLVNQAAFTNMNTVLAQAQRQMLPQQLQSPQQRVTPTNTQPNRSQRTFIGIVTKLMETYGFVDEDVFFQTNVIRGSMPRVGDRVMVEANYNPSMPFKWNARSIEKIQNVEYRQETTQQYQSHQNRQVQQPQNGTSSRWNDRPPRDEFPREPRRQPPMSIHRTPPRDAAQKRPLSRQRSPFPRKSPPRRQESTVSKREREVRDETETREKDRESTRARSPQSGKRDTASPPRRRQRIIPRYHCNVSKQTIPGGELKYAELRKRYLSLYIPSDFIRCKFSWVDSVKLETPLQFSPHPIKFHVLHKDVDVLLDEGKQLPLENPPDADSRFVVKVLLISHPGLTALRRKLSGLMPDGSIDESTETQPLSKSIQILVGYRGKGEFMCIGGAWSPSLDGTNPLDPQSMVNTAIRTTLSLTGIDLSRCAKWYKMLHLHYFRPERSRVDSCVLMLPDTSTITDFQLSDEQYQQTVQKLQDQLASKLSAIDAQEFVSPRRENEKGLNLNSGDGEAAAAETGEKINQEERSGSGGIDQSPKQPAVGDQHQTETTNTSAPEVQDEADSTVTCETIVPNSSRNGKTHWSTLEQNIKAMKVAELRDELEARKLESRGVKNVLMQRLHEAIEREKNEENPTEEQTNELIERPTETNTDDQKQQNEASEKQSIVVQIKEEIIELMETDEAGEKSDEKGKDKAQEDREKVELEKSKAKFEKEKKERKAALERHYSQIPKNEPGIFVYPSKMAKSGKFDCKVMTFHSLLEYNKEHDNKEASFEVFLFVEALKEVFDRANAFVIYHTVSTALEREVEKKRRNEALSEACKDEEVVLLEGSSSKEEKTEASKSNNTELRSNFKALVHNFEAFIAFAHFDINICGYIIDKDLEDIIFSIGLDVSRWDVQRLVKKLLSKERINYRDLTDKWVDKEGKVRYVPLPSYENIFQSFSEHAKGHKTSGDLFNSSSQNNNEMSDPKLISESEFAYFEGSLINIKQSIERQYALEKERQETVDQNEKLTLQLNSINEQREHLEKKKRRLEDDVDRYKKKLYDSEKLLKKEQEDNASMKTSLLDCKRYGERMVAVVEKVLPPPSKKEEKEKSSGSDKNGTSGKEKDNEVANLNTEDGVEKGDDQQQKLLIVDAISASLDKRSCEEKGDGRENRAGSV